MPQKQTFTASIIDAGGGGAYVKIPFDVEEYFGSKRPKIKATIDGIPYRGTLVRMGTECHVLLILKAIREQIGKTFGDEVQVVVEEDTEPRVVAIPSDVQEMLDQNPDVKTFFEKQSYSHQREYIKWIEEAKRAGTRQNRIIKMLEMLKEGKTAR